MENLKEFTRQEFNEFVEKNNFETFSQKQVDAFCRDVLEKSEKKEIDEFELNCAAADKISLTPVIVQDNDLSKSLVYYREAQREPIENLPDGIFKSMNDEQCLRYKETPLNIFKGIAGINCADKDALEKAKALPLGTEKMYGGKMYVKTEKGWRPKKKGDSAKNTSSESKKQSLDTVQGQVSYMRSKIKELPEESRKKLNPLLREASVGNISTSILWKIYLKEKYSKARRSFVTVQPAPWDKRAEEDIKGLHMNEETADINEDKKIPGSFKIENKTFHVKDGVATISMYDKQSRISKLQKLAKEHGFKINYEK